jgi:glutamate dehydrogenase (NAD(P)+)
LICFLQTMAWILDEYSKFHGHSPAVVTGKPIVSTYRNISLETSKPCVFVHISN